MVVLACDLAKMGGELGVESKMRCAKAASEFFEYTRQNHNVEILLSAGMAPRKLPNQKKTMAEMMKEHLMIYHKIPVGNITVCGSTWGTRGEIREAIKTAREAKLTWAFIHVAAVSSLYHIPRIWVIMRKEISACVDRRNKKRWRTRYIPSGGRLKTALWELVKFPLEVLGVAEYFNNRGFHLSGWRISKRARD